MTLREKYSVADTRADTSTQQSHPRLEAKHSRRVAVVLFAVGISLLVLAGGDVLADLSLGGHGDDVLRGSQHKEALLGFGGDDELWGFAGDDTLYGGKGDDELYGGTGRDALFAGPGDDFVEAKDNQRDYVDCGGEYDEASIDPRDRVAPDCEKLFR